jgi:hypothetical protein
MQYPKYLWRCRHTKHESRSSSKKTLISQNFKSTTGKNFYLVGEVHATRVAATHARLLPVTSAHTAPGRAQAFEVSLAFLTKVPFYSFAPAAIELSIMYVNNRSLGGCD